MHSSSRVSSLKERCGAVNSRTIRRSARNANAADVLDAVAIGEAEVAIEAVPHIVAVEQHCVPARDHELFIDDVGNRRFPGTRQSGQPQYRRSLSLQCGALLTADGQRLPANIIGPPPAKGDHPGAGRFIRQAVDQDEGTGVAVGLVAIERYRRGGRQVTEPNLVEAHGLVSQLHQARVSTLIRCVRAVTVAGTVRVPIFSSQERPATRGCSLSQIICAADWSTHSGGSPGRPEDRHGQG